VELDEKQFECLNVFSRRERDVLLHGGLINYVKEAYRKRVD
jgi:DNA-binding winged helix-turn-helix (wHTH) protein